MRSSIIRQSIVSLSYFLGLKTIAKYQPNLLASLHLTFLNYEIGIIILDLESVVPRKWVVLLEIKSHIPK